MSRSEASFGQWVGNAQAEHFPSYWNETAFRAIWNETAFRAMEREKGSETGIHRGRSFTRDPHNSAGFANPGTDSVRHRTTPDETALGNWWETDGGRVDRQALR
jgi:hypothetical protein